MAWMRAPLLLALCLGNAEYLRTLQEVNLVPEDEAADLKKQEEAQREKALAEAAAAMEKAKAMLAEAEKAKPLSVPSRTTRSSRCLIWCVRA